MKKINYGKRFEQDFQASAIKAMDVTRLKDSPSSFNSKCFKCPHKKIRFTPRNICDFICFKQPNQFYFELKSHLKKSMPFEVLSKGPKDTRIYEMAMKENDNPGIFSFVIFNWRDCDNETWTVRAEQVNDFMKTSERKSIPYDWTVENGIQLEHKLKKVRYFYNVGLWLNQKLWL